MTVPVEPLSPAEMEAYRTRVLAGEYIPPEEAARIIATLRAGRLTAAAASKAKKAAKTSGATTFDQAAAEAELDDLLGPDL
jgi:membrane protein involved in colicin uptake